MSVTIFIYSYILIINAQGHKVHDKWNKLNNNCRYRDANNIKKIQIIYNIDS